MEKGLGQFFLCFDNELTDRQDGCLIPRPVPLNQGQFPIPHERLLYPPLAFGSRDHARSDVSGLSHHARRAGRALGARDDGGPNGDRWRRQWWAAAWARWTRRRSRKMRRDTAFDKPVVVKPIYNGWVLWPRERAVSKSEFYKRGEDTLGSEPD